MILDMIKRWFGGGTSREQEKSDGFTARSEEALADTRMLTCQEALEWMYEFMDGELPDADAARVDQHFKMCQACYPHLQLEESFRSRLRAAAGRTGVPEAVRSRVLELLAQEEAGG